MNDAGEQMGPGWRYAETLLSVTNNSVQLVPVILFQNIL